MSKIGMSRNALPFVLLFVLFWGLEIFATKVAFNSGAKVLPFTIQSASCSFIALFIWVVPRNFGQLVYLFSVNRKLLVQICAANALHYAVGSFLYCCGASLTSAVNLAFLVTLATPFTSILAVFILKESIPPPRALLLCTLGFGSYILTTNLQELSPVPGDLLIIGAAFFWALGNVLMRGILRNSQISGEVVSLLKPVIGIPVFVFATIFASSYPEPLHSLFMQSVFYGEHFLFASVAGILAALLWIFLYRSLKLAESAYVSMIGMATPVLVTVLAVLFLNEQVSMAQAIGGLIIIVSGVLTHWTSKA